MTAQLTVDRNSNVMVPVELGKGFVELHVEDTAWFPFLLAGFVVREGENKSANEPEALNKRKIVIFWIFQNVPKSYERPK